MSSTDAKGHAIVGMVFVIQVANVEPGCSSVWAFCIATIVHSFLVVLAIWNFFVRPGAVSTGEQHQQQPWICGCFTLALMIWGSVILSQLSNDASCKSSYETETPSLWTYFLVTFAYSVALLAFECCCVCQVRVNLNFGAQQEAAPVSQPLPQPAQYSFPVPFNVVSPPNEI